MCVVDDDLLVTGDVASSEVYKPGHVDERAYNEAFVGSRRVLHRSLSIRLINDSAKVSVKCLL